MKYAFGLVSLLMVTAIILFLFSKYEIPMARKGKDAQEQVQPITGQTAEGVAAKDSVQVDGQMVGGQLRSLQVTQVTPGGYFEQYYGLKVGDKVLQINGVDVGTFGDPGMAEAELWSAQSRPITISRNGQSMTLSAGDGSLGKPGGASGAAPPSPSTPGTPAAPGGTGIPGFPGSIQIPNQQ
jgi:hypothetical protein